MQTESRETFPHGGLIMRHMFILSSSFFLIVNSASAGTVYLSGGTIDYQTLEIPDASVSFDGNRGFTFRGRLENGTAPSGCHSPGENINLGATSSGDDMPGTTTLDGNTYSTGSHFPLMPEIGFEITGEGAAPPVGSSTTGTLVAPAAFTGFFSYFTPPPESPIRETLVGDAVATLAFTQMINAFGNPIWCISHLTYDISPTVFPVTIQVTPSNINSRSKGVISVAILSSDTVDPSTIDQTTLKFGETGDEQSLISCAPLANDLNGDGVADLVCRFARDTTGFRTGDTTGVLTGLALDGRSLRGTDSVRVIH